MLKLGKENFFCSGGNRDIYYYSNKTKLVKITKTEALKERKSRTNIFKKIRPLKYFDENYEDFSFFRKLKKNGLGCNFVPKFYGFVKTNLGYGIVSENILNYNGTQAINLEDFIKNLLNGTYTADINLKLKSAFYNLVENMVETNFICKELKDFNIVVRENKNGTYKFYIIDGFGNSEFIPVSNYIKILGTCKIIRQCKRFKKYMEKKYCKID